jgi:hypothetical protein
MLDMVTAHTSPQADLGRPSYLPTALTSFFFGLVGLWPAIRHSALARRRGFSTGGYWMAWIVGWAAGSLSITAIVLLAAIPSGDLSPNTKVAIGSALLIVTIFGVAIWSDLRADSTRNGAR